VVYVFVPLYFAYSGLNTELGAMNSVVLVFAMLFQTFLASVGKVLPITGLAYTVYKYDGIFSLGLGALVNTRGLVSLIAANIGLQEKVLNPTSFSMLVLVNVLTTVATPPLFYTLYENYGLDKQYSAPGEETPSAPGEEKTNSPVEPVEIRLGEGPEGLGLSKRHSLLERHSVTGINGFNGVNGVNGVNGGAGVDGTPVANDEPVAQEDVHRKSLTPFKTAKSLSQEW